MAREPVAPEGHQVGSVSASSVFDDDWEGITLELPEEPVELRSALRDALLDGKQWRDGLDDDLCIGRWLWERWGLSLEHEGLDRDGFFDALEANRRELWLWLVGERQWVQFLEGQAGRIVRRLPSAGGSSATDAD
jgi:hypothetical protein